ncbi:hypothetical protein MY04_0621 [Flammeovirga sp. MY04]|nr:hypothetical protein [Flammeovirga sp. MY04]ANQ48003.1 hypothetical protein MY04_0621 [Flammeovirga sp. MY04]MBB3700834.1 hypothetical protein [Flammeovirga yaeyamensis]NMF37942.1 hypothetical protein [Flammeovirga yaeyamensis]
MKTLVKIFTIIFLIGLFLMFNRVSHTEEVNITIEKTSKPAMPEAASLSR